MDMCTHVCIMLIQYIYSEYYWGLTIDFESIVTVVCWEKCEQVKVGCVIRLSWVLF